MSRGKRQFDEEGFDEYAFWDDRIRGDGRARLEDVPPSNQDYGVGPGYLGRIRQSPRSPSVAGDDEIRPSRRRAASPDDSDRGGERRALRKVGDAYDADDEPRVSVADVKNSIMSSNVYRDWALMSIGKYDADAIYNGNFAFLNQQRVVNSDTGTCRLNNLQLRGMLWIDPNSQRLFKPDYNPDALFVELVVVYDRSRVQFSAAHTDENHFNAPFAWSDVFSPSGSFSRPVTSGTDTGIESRVFDFTSPETSYRFRIMFRKFYKLDLRRVNQTYTITGGTSTNIDPALNQTLSLASQSYGADGYEIVQYSSNGNSCCLIDEFINLCHLPCKHRTGPDFDTAVDAQGAVYIGLRSSGLDGYGCNFNAYVNTRLNMDMEAGMVPQWNKP